NIMELEYELSGVVQRFRNDKPVFSIGRGPGNDLVILDGSVSGKHARITDAPDLATVEDLGSTNGTYLNGDQVKGRGQFAAGDRPRSSSGSRSSRPRRCARTSSRSTSSTRGRAASCARGPSRARGRP